MFASERHQSTFSVANKFPERVPSLILLFSPQAERVTERPRNRANLRTDELCVSILLFFIDRRRPFDRVFQRSQITLVEAERLAASE
jgi:hypothetical protein